MSIGFYPRLAADGIRKNRRMYLPYILTCIGMVAMTYVINYLKDAESIAALPGGHELQLIMGFGGWVIVFFAALFLFYTNAFLIRRRKKEFGLYNILGMGKKSIGRILLWETLYIVLLALGFGLIGGFAVSKLAELGFVNFLEGQVSYSLSVSASGIISTVLPFAGIFLLLFMNTMRQVWFSSTISLLRSENAGEKPPRANWLFGGLGILILGAAYHLAVTIKNPMQALGIFFVAVLMVIAATYLIMVAGSVWLCRILQKKKSYYYKANHFVSVSSMVYRMKRNGAGLASICVLATMVLVISASTSALFFGGEDVIQRRYPREINTWFRMYENRNVTEEDKELLLGVLDEVLEKHHVKKENIINYQTVAIAGLLNGGDVIYDTTAVSDFTIGTYSDVVEIYFIPLEDYNALMNRSVTLGKDEALVYSYRIDFDGDTFGLKGKKAYRVKEHLTECFVNADAAMDIVPSLIVVVPDVEAAGEGITTSEGLDMTFRKWYYCFDAALGAEENIALYQDIKAAYRTFQSDGHDFFSSTIESRDNERMGFFAMYGGLFYLGLLLSIVFIFAAVLIIYYKQISEGYEDQSRFEIMQKVGMTKREIKRSINSQLLTVFFLPLLLAGLHLAFAFPIIEKLLMCFNLNNRLLFVGTTVGSFLIFALLYAVVYRITAKAYYQIVSR